jgi:RimJ/RimL family protein N-acetyltransferase
MYDMQLDPEANRMAVTLPRTGEAFDSHWAKALADPGNTTRAVLVGEAMVGYISCFPMDGQDHVGYWIDRAYWGMGIASRSLHLLLREVVKRPLVASAATSNTACSLVAGIGTRVSPMSCTGCSSIQTTGQSGSSAFS